MFSQIRQPYGDFWQAKEWSKSISLFKGKKYLLQNIFDTSEATTKFQIIALTGSSSGEITTLMYNCEQQNKEGLILGFYGDYWNESGVFYKGFAFKNFNKSEATKFLDKIQSVINENEEFLKDDKDNNNIVFQFDDIDILIYYDTINSPSIRLFWRGFDSTWEYVAYMRSKRRFEVRSND